MTSKIAYGILIAAYALALFMVASFIDTAFQAQSEAIAAMGERK